MKKRIFPRILCFLLLNCTVFMLLAALQFTRGGNFSRRIGEMLISGRYSTNEPSDRRSVDGGLSVVFGGLEFQLGSLSGTGFYLVDSQNQRHQTAAEFITIMENGAVFTLSGGTEVSFINQNPEGISELQINGKFPDDISAIEIPFKTRRSLVVRNNNDTLNILYNGDYYQFNRPMYSLESGQLVLFAAAPAISYRVVTNQKEFNPVDFIIPRAETAQVFSGVLSQWISYHFAVWSEMGSQIDEDTVIAWCGEAVRQGNYRSAVSAIPVSFSSSPLRTWESAVYQFDRRIGVWENAAKAIDTFERDKINRISRLLAEKDNRLFAENHLIEFLAIRNDNQLIDDILSFTQEIDPFTITFEISSGILENYLDMGKWRPNTVNPFEPLSEQICQIIAEGLQRTGDQIFVFSDNCADIEFSLRLGKAIYEWGEKSGNNDWAGVGRSLVLSVFSLGNEAGLFPAALTIEKTGGDFTLSREMISSAKVYRILNDSEYLPHWTTTGINGIRAWTAASSVSIAQNNTMMDISIRFPVGETHYIMLRNVRPFPLLQIYEMNWRRAVDFESYYNSSGWYYFEQEQILVLKINQRSNVESVKIYYTVPSSPEQESVPVSQSAPVSQPTPESQTPPVQTERPYQY